MWPYRLYYNTECTREGIGLTIKPATAGRTEPRKPPCHVRQTRQRRKWLWRGIRRANRTRPILETISSCATGNGGYFLYIVSPHNIRIYTYISSVGLNRFNAACDFLATHFDRSPRQNAETVCWRIWFMHEQCVPTPILLSLKQTVYSRPKTLVANDHIGTKKPKMLSWTKTNLVVAVSSGFQKYNNKLIT